MHDRINELLVENADLRLRLAEAENEKLKKAVSDLEAEKIGADLLP